MATAEQLKSLVRSHFGDDPERFFAVALQVAAHEAKQGHGDLAHDLRSLIDKARRQAEFRVITPPSRDLTGLVVTATPKERISDLVVADAFRDRLQRILVEFRQQEKLKQHGLCHRRKILLVGPPGTGKTMTAAVLAGELHLPLCTILVDKLVTKFMGETSAKLRQIFDIVQESRGVYVFDEFDAIGAERGLDNDVGEMRRVLNSFLQFIEQDPSDSLIIAATNNPGILDHALFRRFDDVLSYDLPGPPEAAQLIANRLGQFRGKRTDFGQAAEHAQGLSHADIARACDDAVKDTILAGRKTVSVELLIRMLDERHSAYTGKRGDEVNGHR